MKNLRARAEKWMDENPEAMRLIRKYASQMLALGRPFGVRFIVERVRWDFAIRRRPGAEFKFNDNYIAYVARKLISENRRFAGLIEVRYTRC